MGLEVGGWGAGGLEVGGFVSRGLGTTLGLGDKGVSLNPIIGIEWRSPL